MRGSSSAAVAKVGGGDESTAVADDAEDGDSDVDEDELAARQAAARTDPVGKGDSDTNGGAAPGGGDEGAPAELSAEDRDSGAAGWAVGWGAVRLYAAATAGLPAVAAITAAFAAAQGGRQVAEWQLSRWACDAGDRSGAATAGALGAAGRWPQRLCRGCICSAGGGHHPCERGAVVDGGGLGGAAGRPVAAACVVAAAGGCPGGRPLWWCLRHLTTCSPNRRRARGRGGQWRGRALHVVSVTAAREGRSVCGSIWGEEGWAGARGGGRGAGV